jgi:hypothetical protein
LEGLAMEKVGIFYGPFYGLLLYFMDIWYSSLQFGNYFPVLVFCTKKNLATLVQVGTQMDLFTTFAKLAGIQVPTDRVIDGIDLVSI